MAKHLPRVKDKQRHLTQSKTSQPAYRRVGQTGSTALMEELTRSAAGEVMAHQTTRLGDPRLQTAQRQALASQIGRVQGNQHLQKMVAALKHEQQPPFGQINHSQPQAMSPGQAVQRQAEAGEQKPASFELSNSRFTKISRLRQIAAGQGALSSRDNGHPVKATQQALLDLGYSLLRFHCDGKFGSETDESITQFRTDRGIPGQTLDVVALAVLDQVAPPPGVSQEHYVDYERLLADNQIDFTIALGYDEALESHQANAEAVRNWLSNHQFQQADLAQPGLERYQAQKEITYPTALGERQTKQIIVNLNLITPGQGAAANFGQALNESEITIYLGHARLGVGPDFDDKHSAAENFVIGVNSALHKAGRVRLPTNPRQTEVVRDAVNDLEQMTSSGQWDENRYRVWFFNACTTLAYMDELRGGLLPEGVDRSNLDVFGSNRSVPIAAGLPTTLALVEGILSAQTMEQIVTTLNQRTAETLLAAGVSQALVRQYRDLYFREGAGDNPVK